MWVSQLDDFLATVKLLYSKYNIGMTLYKTLIVRKSIIVARCASCNDILRAIVLTKNIPELVLSEVNVIVDLIGTTMKGSDCDDRSSSLDMIVVSVILGECFLKNRAPEGAILADFSEKSLIGAIILPLKGKPVIDDDSVLDTKSVHVDTIDASCVQLIIVVQEGILETAWNFR